MPINRQQVNTNRIVSVEEKFEKIDGKIIKLTDIWSQKREEVDVSKIDENISNLEAKIVELQAQKQDILNIV